MATFWERADNTFFCSLFILAYYNSVIFHFGFEGRTLVLIVSVADHCLCFTFYIK